MSDLLTNELLDELVAAQQAPCLSLYQSTHRRHPENQQDPIRFRNLVNDLERSLRQRDSDMDLTPLLQPFEALARDPEFWNSTLDGLAVLSGPGLLRVLRLQRPVPELAIVADSFHTKPLRRLLQSVGRYQVLGLSLRGIRLFEGNRDALDEIELTQPHLTVAAPRGVSRETTQMRHGYGGQKDEADIETERFFRAVDRAVSESHSQPSGLPLILAALSEHHQPFRRVSHNPLLMAEGLAVNPETLPLDELRERAWKLVEPQYQAHLAALVDAFGQARSDERGSDDLEQVAEAAAAGRVETLLIEADRQIAGRVDGATGRIELADLSHPQVDDLLDDLADLVEKMGGRVFAIPAERMPGRTGLAASFRF